MPGAPVPVYRFTRQGIDFLHVVRLDKLPAMRNPDGNDGERDEVSWQCEERRTTTQKAQGCCAANLVDAWCGLPVVLLYLHVVQSRCRFGHARIFDPPRHALTSKHLDVDKESTFVVDP